MPRNTLTPKQDAFVREYLVDLNATQAAIRAGYSQRNADKIGPELLGKTRIAEAIERAKARRNKKIEKRQMDALEMVRQLWECASQRVPRVDMMGEPVLDEQGRQVFKMNDFQAATRAADMMMKHQGLYERDNKRELLADISFGWADRVVTVEEKEKAAVDQSGPSFVFEDGVRED